MQTDYAIRRCTSADEEGVVALWSEVLNYPEPHNEPVGRFRRKMACQPELFFVAEREERIIGTAMGGYDGVRGWIYAVAVSPSERGQGIATHLLQYVEEELVKLGCPKINLYVRPENIGMTRFYAKFGYAAEEGVAMSKAILKSDSPNRRAEDLHSYHPLDGEKSSMGDKEISW